MLRTDRVVKNAYFCEKHQIVRSYGNGNTKVAYWYTEF